MLAPRLGRRRAGGPTRFRRHRRQALPRHGLVPAEEPVSHSPRLSSQRKLGSQWLTVFEIAPRPRSEILTFVRMTEEQFLHTLFRGKDGGSGAKFRLGNWRADPGDF